MARARGSGAAAHSNTDTAAWGGERGTLATAREGALNRGKAYVTYVVVAVGGARGCGGLQGVGLLQGQGKKQVSFTHANGAQAAGSL